MSSSNKTCRNPNHPVKGSSTKVDPIKSLESIQQIKRFLADNPRDLCLFTLGINTAYRSIELVSITVGQVAHLKALDRLEIKQSKNRKYRSVTLNETVITAIQGWLSVHPHPEPNAPLFISRTTFEALRSNTVTKYVKGWCDQMGLQGNYGSHTLRKTWGFHQRCTFGHATALLSDAYGHATEAQTLAYLCIQPEEIQELYAEAL